MPDEAGQQVSDQGAGGELPPRDDDHRGQSPDRVSRGQAAQVLQDKLHDDPDPDRGGDLGLAECRPEQDTPARR